MFLQWYLDGMQEGLEDTADHCANCGRMVEVDHKGTVLDMTGGDVCGAFGDNTPHAMGDFEPPRCEADVPNGVCLTPMPVFDKCRNESAHV